ncbi:MAG: RNA polymerase sigma factor [Candidatus Eisenbacteria bacterium]
MDALDENACVARAQAGNMEAFRVLVDRHRERAYTLALRLTGVPADAEEVAQDAFVRAWRALPGFRGEAAFGTWLHRIVSRLALDRRERLVRRAQHETPTAEPPEIVEPASALSDPPGGDDAGSRLARLLEGLPERARAAVVLYYYEDRSVAEVARTLGVPEGTVKTLLSRARATLRESWSREEARAR